MLSIQRGESEIGRPSLISQPADGRTKSDRHLIWLPPLCRLIARASLSSRFGGAAAPAHARALMRNKLSLFARPEKPSDYCAGSFAPTSFSFSQSSNRRPLSTKTKSARKTSAPREVFCGQAKVYFTSRAAAAAAALLLVQ